MPGLQQQPPSSATPSATAGVAQRVWQEAPVALAVVGPHGVLDWNFACRRLLQTVAGQSAANGRRWLGAAVMRLMVEGRETDTVRVGGGEQALILNMGAQPVVGEARVVSLVPLQSAKPEGESLAATVSTLSHELRTPLASMKSSLGLVVAGEAGAVNADQSHFLSMTLRNIDRLERLVGDLLDVSHSGTGRVEPNRREVDLGPLLREALQMQATAAEAAGLELTVGDWPDSLTAWVDPDQVLQILGNIVGNAIKYTPDGGLVRVGVEARSANVATTGLELARELSARLGLGLATIHLSVEDSGPGLSRDDQDRVFEPWFRGGGQAEADTPGAGLGLTITRSLVGAHAGCIRLFSEPGRGTSVWVDLPRDRQSERLMRAARGLGEGADRQARGPVALWDAREFAAEAGEIPADAVASFVAARSGGKQMPVVVMENVWAARVAEPAAWSAGWQEHCRAYPQSGWPAWEFLPVAGAAANEESISGLKSRNH